MPLNKSWDFVVGVILALIFIVAVGHCEPYLQTPFAGPGYGHFYTTQGAAFNTSLDYQNTQTSLAVLYHPLSAGSLIPDALQGWVPPEAWACTAGGNYAPGAGLPRGAGLAVGCGVNLADSARSWLSTILLHASNPSVKKLGLAIAPREGQPTIYVQRQESVQYGGKFTPSWFFGLGFGF